MALPEPRRDAAEHLVRVADLDDLAGKGTKVVKVGKKQIALFKTSSGVYACNNRCPHEGDLLEALDHGASGARRRLACYTL